MKSPFVVKQATHKTKTGFGWEYDFYYQIDPKLEDDILSIQDRYYDLEKTEENKKKLQKEIDELFEKWSKE